MKNKQFALLCFGILASLFLVASASAAIVLNPTSYSASVAQGKSTSFTFTIYNNDPVDGVDTLTSVTTDLSSSTSTLLRGNVTLSVLPTSISDNATSAPVTVTINVPDNQALGTYSGTLTINGRNNVTSVPYSSTISIPSITVTATLQPTDVTTCKVTGNPLSHLDVSVDDIHNNGFGDDSTFYLYDNVTLSVDVSNNGNDTMKNIQVHWNLYDINKQKSLDSGKSSKFSVKDGDDKIVKFDFTIDELNKVQDNSGDNYKLFVWATAEDEGTNNADICASDSQDISIATDEFVILNNIVVPDSVPCGSQFEVLANVVNIGDSDLEGIVANVYNKEFGINQNIPVGDINAYENTKFDQFFNIPQNAAEGNHFLTVKLLDDNGDVFKNSNDKESTFAIAVPVAGSCLIDASTEVTATLQSGGKAGQDMVIDVLLKNTGKKTMTFTLTPTGYTSWATSAVVDQPSVTLNAGQAKDVLVTLATKNTVSGAETFSADIYVGDQLVTSQPVKVQLVKSGLNFSGGIQGNTALIMGLVILILIVVIILVSVRVSRK